MEDNVKKLILEQPIIVPRILFNNYKKLGLSEEELVVIMLIISYGNKIVYDPSLFMEQLGMTRHKVMKIINDLLAKNIVSLVIEKVSRKNEEYITLDLLYDKLLNIVIDKEESEEEVDNKIFSIFESEFGRTLSSMEYGQVMEWLTSGVTEELITCALREAVLNGVSNFRYIDSILNDWKKKGYKNKEDVMKEKERYRNKKKEVSVFDTDWLND